MLRILATVVLLVAMVAAIAAAGCAGASAGPESASADLPAGGTLTTDTEGNKTDPSDPIETWVTTSVAGTVSIDEAPRTGRKAHFTDSGWAVDITAPEGAPTTPLVLVFALHASTLGGPGLRNAVDLAVFRDDDEVRACADGGSGIALPDPCVATRVLGNDGGIDVTVLTSRASTWTFAVAGDDDLEVAVSARLDTTVLGPATVSLTEGERRAAAQVCVELAGDRCRTGPIFYSANAGGAEVTQHIVDAQQNGYPAILTYQERTARRPDWGDAFPESDCGSYDRDTQQCDEYPFWSTVQGYHRERGDNAPSLRPVTSSSNSSHGASFGGFRDQCRREVILQRQDFFVVPVPDAVSSTTSSFWTCDDREPSPRANPIDVVLYEDPFICDDSLRPAGALFGFVDGETVVLEWAGGSSEDVVVGGAREFVWRCVAGIDVRFRAVGLESDRAVEFTMPAARPTEVRVPCELAPEEPVTPRVRGFRHQDREISGTYAFPLEPFEACYDLADYGPDTDAVRIDNLELVTEVARAGGYSKVETERGQATWVRTENLIDSDCRDSTFTFVTQRVRFRAPAGTRIFWPEAVASPYPWCAGEPNDQTTTELFLEINHFSPDGWVRDTAFDSITYHVEDLECVELEVESAVFDPPLAFEVTPESGLFATEFAETDCAPVLGATGSLPTGTVIEGLGLVRHKRDSPQSDSVFVRYLDDRGLSTYVRREDVMPIEGTPPDCDVNAVPRPFDLDDRDWFVSLGDPAQLYWDPASCAAASRLVENSFTGNEFQERSLLNEAVQVIPLEEANGFVRIFEGGDNVAKWIERDRLIGLADFSAATELETIGMCDSAGAFAGIGFGTSFCIYTNGPQIKSVLDVEFGSGGVGASLGFGLSSANTTDLDRLGGVSYCKVASLAAVLGVEGAYCTSQPDGFAQTFTASVTLGPEVEVSGAGFPLAVREARGTVLELKEDVRQAAKDEICGLWAPFELVSARVREICDTPLGPVGSDPDGPPVPGPPFGEFPTTEVLDGLASCPLVSDDGSVVAFLEEAVIDDSMEIDLDLVGDRWVTIYQPQTNSIRRVPVPPIPVPNLGWTDFRAECPSVSNSGDVVVLTAPTLYPGDGNDCGLEFTPDSQFGDESACDIYDGLEDVYAYNVRSGNLRNLTEFWRAEWLWRAGDSGFAKAGAQASAVSGDGRTVVFRRETYSERSCTQLETDTSCLVATGPLQDVPIDSWVVLDVASGEQTEISIDVDADFMGLSDDGNIALFDIDAEGVGLNDLYLYNRASGGVSLVATDTRGIPPMTPDGSALVYQKPNTDGDGEFYLYDVRSGNSDRLVIGKPTSITADGSLIGFARYSFAGPAGFFVYDVERRATTQLDARVTLDAPRPSVGETHGPFLSSDGRRAIFLAATDPNDSLDYYLHELDTGETIRVTRGAFVTQHRSKPTQATFLAWPSPISADATTLVFRSDAINFVPNMPSSDGEADLFVVALPE